MLVIVKIMVKRMKRSAHAKAIDFVFQQLGHPGDQLALGAVGGQLQPVEARVGLRVGIVLLYRRPLYGELVYLVPVALQEGKTEDRHSPGASDEVKQVTQLFLVETVHIRPEPVYLGIACGVVDVEGVAHPIGDVDDLRAVEQHLHLVRLEDRDDFQGQHLANAFPQLADVALAALHAEVVYQSVHVFPLVGVVDEDVPAVGLELHFLLLVRLVSGKVREVDDEFFGVGSGQRCLQVVVEFAIVAVEVAKLDLLSADLAPYASGEEAIEGNSIKQRLPDHDAQQVGNVHPKLVLALGLHVLHHEAVGGFVGLAEAEQACDVGVEDILNAEVHPLPQDSSCIVDLLAAELDLELLPEVHALEGVVAGHEHVVAVHLQPLAAALPGDAHLLHLDAHPRHLLLETELLDDIDRIIARLHRQQDHRLLRYPELYLLRRCWHLHVHQLVRILPEI